MKSSIVSFLVLQVKSVNPCFSQRTMCSVMIVFRIIIFYCVVFLPVFQSFQLGLNFRYKVVNNIITEAKV